MRKRILLVAEAVTLAHVVRLLELSKYLASERYEVLFACDSRSRSLLAAEGVRYAAIKSIPSASFLDRVENGKLLYRFPELQEYVREELNLIDSFKPDLIVGDLRLSLAVSSVVTSIPLITLVNAYWSPWSSANRLPTPEISGLPLARFSLSRLLCRMVEPFVVRLHAQALNKLRRQYKLSPFKSAQEGMTFGNLTLYPDIPQLVQTNADLPQSHRYIGPVLWSAPAALPSWWNSLDRSRPIVYLSLGSSGPVRILPEILRVLSELEVTVLASTAGRFSPAQQFNSIHFSEFLPGDKASELADLVICNGGSPASYQSLACGKPVIGIASNLDQLLNMRNIERRSAGTLIRLSEFNSEAFKKTVLTFVSDPRYRISAQQIQAELAQLNSKELFLSAVDQLLKRQDPGWGDTKQFVCQ